MSENYEVAAKRSSAGSSDTASGGPHEPGSSWTTDAPFRETAASIAERREQGIHIVEMEAAALLAFAKAKAVPVICIAHITNAMGQSEGDFAKGKDCGAKTALLLVAEFARRFAGLSKS